MENKPKFDVQHSVVETKEKSKNRENLDSAVKKLESIIKRLEKNSRESMRAEHTLSAIKNALDRLGKDGAKSGFYSVPVEGYPGNPQAPYTQEEGVPVDELIDILRTQAQELNKGLPTKKQLEDKKKESESLWQVYTKLNERPEYDDAGKEMKYGADTKLAYEKWREVQNAYLKMLELHEMGSVKSATELSDLADELYKNSKSYFEAHYTKAHGEDAKVWTQAERDRQDLRTRLEAKLMSLDYRDAGSEEGNYQGSMGVFKYRRELDLSEKKEVPPPPVDTGDGDVKIEPVPPVVPPVEPPQPKLEKPTKATAVEGKDLVEFLARERADKILNEKLNHKSWLKRAWTRAWEPAYRAMLTEEEKKKMLGKENKPSWFKRTFFGAKEGAATGVKNLMAGTGKEAASQAELQALVERFQSDYAQNAEGEQKIQLDDIQIKNGLNNLVHRYATGTMTDADFEQQKDIIMREVANRYPEVIEHDGLSADNFLEAAKQFQKIFIHNKGLARTDVQLEISLGQAKRAIKTEANLTWVDKSMSWLQKHVGPGWSPEAVGVATSIGSLFSKKPLYWLGGAAGLGGIMGVMRKNVERKQDLAMHRTERAMGDQISDFGPDAKRRQEAEKFVYKMEKASDIVTKVTTLSRNFQTTPTKASADALVSALAEAEARQSLSTSRGRDLISFSGETVLERNRFELLRTLAEATVLLKNSPFSRGEIKTTDEYKNFMTSLGGDMDKIDSSEKWSRWSANAKAGVTGAAFGLVAGAASQQAMAFVGDHVPGLHWLRLNGRQTSLERLYDYVNGHAPVGPTGANPVWINSVSHSGLLKIDGSTHTTYDKVTGLWSLHEAGVSNPKTLAQFALDPSTGRVTPVPGSFDPNTIGFNEAKIGGGQRTLAEWLESTKGNFGKNVAMEKWHLGGSNFLENNTQLPKTEFNELRLFTSYDAKGHLVIDASKLQEFVTNDSGLQTEGSSHGNEILEVAKAFDQGKIQIGLIPDASNPSDAIKLMMDPVTKQFTSTDGSDITKFFTPDPKTGLPVLKGNAVLGMIHDIGTRADGSTNVEWINATRGNGQPIDTGKASQLVTEITRSGPKEWGGLWAWYFRRNALEEKKEGQKEQGGGDKKTEDKQGPKKETFIPFGGKKDGKNPSKGEISRFEIPEDEDNKIKGKKIKKVAVDTRGQAIGIGKGGDRKDHGKEYPGKFPFKNEKEMAAYLSAMALSGQVFVHPKDKTKLEAQKTQAEKEALLESLILEERENLQVGSEKFDQKKIGKIIDTVLKEVDSVFNKYSKDSRSELPAKEKIHVLGLLEYQAQAGRDGKNALGVCFSSSGEIFINFEALKEETTGPDQFMAQLKRTIAHEITHDAAANNYWMFEVEGEGEKEIAIRRRSGLVSLRRQLWNGKTLVERGRALNEAITETLAEEITNSLYKKDKVEKPSYGGEPYLAERKIMEMLQKKFDIKFEDFAKAAINRKALRGLVEKLEYTKTNEGTKGERVRPQFMSLIMSVMDFEHHASTSPSFELTKKLIEGKTIVIPARMKAEFPSSLLDKKGNIKQSIVERYNLVDQEARERLPIAA